MNHTRHKPRIHQHGSAFDTLYRLLDVSSILVAMVAAVTWRVGGIKDEHLLAGAVAVIVFYILSEITGLYRNWRAASLDREVLCAGLTWLISIPVLLSLAVMTQYAEVFPRKLVVSWTLFGLLTLVFSRLGVRLLLYFLRSHGFNSRSYAIVGLNELGVELSQRIENAPELGLKLAGYYDDRSDDRVPQLAKSRGTKLGTVEELVAAARDGRVNMIFITFPMRAEQRIRNVLAALGDTTASVYLVPDFFVFQLLHSRWTNISGLPAVGVFEHPFYGVDGFVKRACDIVLASLILIAVAIPMIIIAILVKRSSPGPVFFRQKRYGLDGQEIMVWKFRSMRVCETGDAFTQATRNDPRITRIGAVLRRTSLDELPQLFNVVEGSMSLVGPRPHASLQNEEYRKLIEGYMLRHKVKPGITGLAQVNGWRGETDTLEKMEKRIECDHQYIREWSLFMDLKILLRTIFVVVSRQNAY